MGANDYQVGGGHYVEQSIQPWDYIVSNDMGFLEGNIVKYISRYKYKDGINDLEKALHYLTKLIEITNERNRQHERLQKASTRQSVAAKHKAKQVRTKQVRRV
jgi:hypothetical protein